MIIKITSASDCKEHTVTDENVYHQRRDVIKKMGFLGAASLLSLPASAGILDIFGEEETPDALFAQNNLSYAALKGGIGEALTPEAKITSHNNFHNHSRLILGS